MNRSAFMELVLQAQLPMSSKGKQVISQRTLEIYGRKNYRTIAKVKGNAIGFWAPEFARKRPATASCQRTAQGRECCR